MPEENKQNKDVQKKRASDNSQSKEKDLIKKSITHHLKRLSKFLIYCFIFFILAFVILFFTEGVKKDNVGVCYGASEFGRNISFSFDVSRVKGGGSGVDIADFQFVGPNPEWIDSGLITTGDMIELYASGLWYPWGKDFTSTNVKEIKAPNGDSKYEFVPQICEMSDNLYTNETCTTGNDPVTGNCKYSETAVFALNPLNRYFKTTCSSNVSLTQQSAYINDYHLPDASTVSKLPNGCITYDKIYNDIINASNSATTCAMENGYGVYMRLGNDDIAYHIANKRVGRVEKSLKDSSQYQIAYNKYGVRETFSMPFTLPTTDYDYTKILEGLNNYSDLSSSDWLTFVDQAKTNYIQFHTSDSCVSTNLSDDIEKNNKTPSPSLCEFGYPKEGQKIYFTLSDINYDDNEGSIALQFRRGARYADTSKQQGIFNYIWEAIMSQKVFGIHDGHLERDGLIIQLRNAILTHPGFQAIAYTILITSLVFYGYGLLMATEAISTKDIINKFLHIGFGLWSLDPNNYDFLDEFMVPIFLDSASGITGVLINGVLKVNGISSSIINPTNPFASFDGVFQDLFSDVLFAKLLAMFNKSGIFIFFPSIIICALIVVVIFLFRSVSIVMLSTLTIGIYFALMPFATIGLLYSTKFKANFDKIIQGLINKNITGMMNILIFTLVLGLIMKFIKRLLDYEVCFDTLIDLYFFSFSSWYVKANMDASTVITNLAMMLFVVYVGSQSSAFVNSFTSSIFGGDGDNKFGEGLFDKIFDGSVGSVTKGIGSAIGVNASITSKDIANPAEMIHSGVSKLKDMVMSNNINQNTSSQVNKKADKKKIKTASAGSAKQENLLKSIKTPHQVNNVKNNDLQSVNGGGRDDKENNSIDNDSKRNQGKLKEIDAKQKSLDKEKDDVKKNDKMTDEDKKKKNEELDKKEKELKKEKEAIHNKEKGNRAKLINISGRKAELSKEKENVLKQQKQEQKNSELNANKEYNNDFIEAIKRKINPNFDTSVIMKLSEADIMMLVTLTSIAGIEKQSSLDQKLENNNQKEALANQQGGMAQSVDPGIGASKDGAAIGASKDSAAIGAADGGVIGAVQEQKKEDHTKEIAELEVIAKKLEQKQKDLQQKQIKKDIAFKEKKDKDKYFKEMKELYSKFAEKGKNYKTLEGDDKQRVYAEIAEAVKAFNEAHHIKGSAYELKVSSPSDLANAVDTTSMINIMSEMQVNQTIMKNNNKIDKMNKDIIRLKKLQNG